MHVHNVLCRSSGEVGGDVSSFGICDRDGDLVTPLMPAKSAAAVTCFTVVGIKVISRLGDHENTRTDAMKAVPAALYKRMGHGPWGLLFVRHGWQFPWLSH